MDIHSHFFDNDGSVNVIVGQSHFIKTVEDLSEIIVTTVPHAKYGLAFCEASGVSLIRYHGNDEDLQKKAIAMMEKVQAGHSFCIFLKDCFPINILHKVKNCDEVVRVYCATANPLTILTVKNDAGAGIIGVIDGVSPKGIEKESDKQYRKDFLRKIGYKS